MIKYFHSNGDNSEPLDLNMDMNYDAMTRFCNTDNGTWGNGPLCVKMIICKYASMTWLNAKRLVSTYHKKYQRRIVFADAPYFYDREWAVIYDDKDLPKIAIKPKRLKKPKKKKA